jgi:hypothetical protein
MGFYRGRYATVALLCEYFANYLSSITPNLQTPRRALSILLISILALQLIAINSSPSSSLFKPAIAQMQVIDFEDLTPGGPGTGASIFVNSQYSSVGVQFNNPVALDYSKGLAIANFTHSGTKAIEQCYAQEFCSTPITITFTAPQTHVKLWVGFSGSLVEDYPVVMRAFDASGTEVERAETSFPPSNLARPIDTPLEINTPSATIKSVTVGPSTNLQFSNSLSVDDVEFSTAGPPPPCIANSDPVVTLSQPVQLSTQLNRFLLQGSINTASELDSAVLTVVGSGGEKTLNLLLNVVQTNGGNFGPIWIYDSLFPGANTITVTAHNCHGSGSRSTSGSFTPIQDGTHFVFMGMEVTQSVQSIDNMAPLIADKRAIVRVYLRAEGPTTEIRDVRGTLTAYPPGAHGIGLGNPIPFGNPGGSLSYALHSFGNPTTVNNSADLPSKRNDINRSINFELPAEWREQGRIHFTFRPYIQGEQSTIPCEDPRLVEYKESGCDNLFYYPHVTTPRFVTFNKAPPINIQIVNIPYTVSGGTTTWESQTNIDAAVSRIMRSYPTANVVTNQYALTGPGYDHVPGCEEVMDDLFWRAVFTFFEEGSGWRTYGAKAGGDSCSYVPSLVSSGRAGAMPHELIHSYGYWHPGFEPDSSGNCVPGPQDGTTLDTGYPYQNGYLGQLFRDGTYAGRYGLDIGDPSISGSPVLRPDVYTEIMTYCGNTWVSDYSLRHILATACDEQPDECDRALTFGLTITGSPLSEKGWISSHILPRAEAQPSEESTNLMVLGNLNLSNNTLVLQPFALSPDFKLTPRPEKSDFTIDLFDRDGTRLASYPFQPKELTIHESNQTLAIVGEVVPFASGTNKIAIMENATELGSRTVSENAPQVQITFPNGGETLDGATAKVKWEASDQDNDELAFSLLYSADGGKTWDVIEVNIRNQEHEVNLQDIPGSDQALFRVVATDGVNTSSDESDGVFTVPSKPPVARIISPANSTTFSTNQAVIFEGKANDKEDGDLSGEALEWTSDLQGAIGTGRSVTGTGLVSGNHTITLVATDKDGQTGRSAIKINMLGGGPPHADAGPDQWVSPASTVQLDGSRSSGFGSDPSQIKYTWRQTEGPDVSLSTPNGNKTTFTAPEVTSDTRLSFELGVQGSGGSNGTSTVGINVVPLQQERAFTLSSYLDGNVYTVSGKTDNLNPLSLIINPSKSITVNLEEGQRGGFIEMALPKAMIDDISQVVIQEEMQDLNPSVSNNSSTVRFDVPDGATSVEILGAYVVPEFPSAAVISAIAMAGILSIISLARRIRWRKYEQG